MPLLATQFSNFLEAGTDEAGRGCLAGPVTAAAIIFKQNFTNSLINDSKILSAKTRFELQAIIEDNAISYAIAHVDENEIDTINILNASIKAMHLSLEKLNPQPEFILVDGNRFKNYNNVPHRTIVKGDSKYLNIAAASILAKYARDEYMKKIHKEFPMYGWDKNMGYPTKAHREAILKHGPCKYHRKSFRLLNEQLTFHF